MAKDRDEMSGGHAKNAARAAVMKLREILDGVGTIAIAGSLDAEIRAVVCDSRKAQPGALFFALHGSKADGNRFISDAIERGATAIASEDARPEDAPRSVIWVQLKKETARRSLALAAANFFHHPANALKLVGITGTNGKTTVSFLIDSILRAAGHTTGLIGTTGYSTPRGPRKAVNTTPESVDLQEMFAEVRDAGGSAVVLEASSHALAMDRVWGLRFAAAVFTNLTHDHLNFHKTFDAYFAAKRRLFEGTGAGAPQASVINTDDAYGKRLTEDLSKSGHRTITYGLNGSPQIATKKFTPGFNGLEFTAQTPAGIVEVRSTLVGRVNVYNILAAIGAAIALDIPLPRIEAGIRDLKTVPGRFEQIDEGQPFHVVVDYAHADDAIRNLLQVGREITPNKRVLILFGAGGERDRSTRPLMGEAAGSLADLVVLTSDNPRSEDPLRIINDVVVGLQKVNAHYRIEPDRERAIDLIFDEAKPGDLVLLAGKGHENTQILSDRTFEFDDRKMARKVLQARGYVKAAN